MRLRASIAPRSLAVLALFGALALVGCGGGEDPGSASTEVGVAQEPKGSSSTGEGERQAEDHKAAGPSESDRENEASHSPNPPIATERTPGSKAVAPGVPVTTGGDNSVQAFGLESEEEEASQALQALDEYLQARLAGDWQAACEAASQEFREQLEMLAERGKVKGEDVQRPEGCAEILELLYGKAPRQALEESARVKQVLSFRVREDGYAYLIYENETGEVKFIAMAKDNGAWRVNTPEPAEFPETEEQGSPQ